MQDEIDLLKYLGLLRDKVRNNIVALLVIVMLSVGCAVIFFYTYPPRYEAKMIGSSKFLKPEVLIEVIGNLNDQFERQNIDVLSDYLKLDKGVVGSIVSISLQDLRPAVFTPPSATDLEGIREYDRIHYFEIVVQTGGYSNYPEIQQSLITYLGSNEFVQKRIQAIEEQNKVKLAKTREEIEKLNQLREQIYSSGSSKNYTIMDPSSLNDLMVELAGKASTIEYDLKVGNPIQVIQGFIPSSRPYFPRKKHLVLIAIGLAAVASLLFLVIKR